MDNSSAQNLESDKSIPVLVARGLLCKVSFFPLPSTSTDNCRSVLRSHPNEMQTNELRMRTWSKLEGACDK